MILSLSAFMEDFPINLRLLGIGHRQEPINRPAGLALYQWFFCVKGKGEFISDHQRSVVSEGQGLLIYPDIPHIYRSLSEDWTVHFAGFDGSFLRSVCGLFAFGLLAGKLAAHSPNLALEFAHACLAGVVQDDAFEGV